MTQKSQLRTEHNKIFPSVFFWRIQTELTFFVGTSAAIVQHVSDNMCPKEEFLQIACACSATTLCHFTSDLLHADLQCSPEEKLDFVRKSQLTEKKSRLKLASPAAPGD